MASTTSGGNSNQSSPAPSGAGGIVDMLKTPVGMALAAGVVITLIAGYMVF